MKRFIILFLLFLSYSGHLAHAAIPHHHENQDHHEHSHGGHHDDHHDGDKASSLAHLLASVVHIPGSTDLVLGHASYDLVLKIFNTPELVARCELLIAPMIEMDHHPPSHSKRKTHNFSITQTPLRAPPARL